MSFMVMTTSGHVYSVLKNLHGRPEVKKWSIEVMYPVLLIRKDTSRKHSTSIELHLACLKSQHGALSIILTKFGIFKPHLRVVVDDRKCGFISGLQVQCTCTFGSSQ